jgi:hypothetical protein
LPPIIYFLLFIAIGIGTVLAMMIIWTMNKLLTRIKYPPKLRVYSTLWTAVVPSFIGCMLATGPVLLLLTLIKEISEPMFDQVAFKFDWAEWSPEEL